MHTRTLIALLLLCIIALVFAQRDPQDGPDGKEIKKPEGVKNTCDRSIAAKVEDKRAEVFAVANCGRKEEDSGKRFGSVGFRFSTATKTPRFVFTAFNSRDKKESDNVDDADKAFMAVLAFDRIVEYREANGVPGFQPDQGDVFVVNNTLRGTNNVDWSKMLAVRVPTPDGKAQITTVSSTLTTSRFVATLGVTVTPTPVSLKGTNVTGVPRNVLTPNSVKIDLAVKNFAYQSGSSSGFAIGGLLISRRPPKQRSTTRSVSQTSEEAPFEPTTEQVVHDIPDDNKGTANAAFFSFKRWIENRVRSSSGAVVVSKGPMFFTQPLNTTDYDDDEFDKVFTVRRIWFTPNGTRLTDFLWDPAIGSAEIGQGSGDVPSSAAVASAHFALLSVIALILALFL